MSKKVEFAIEMSALKTIVNYVRNGLGSSKTDLGVMLFRVAVVGQGLTMFASDKEVFVLGEAAIKNPQNTEGSFAILGNKLEKLISQVDAEIVRFSVDNENVEVNAGFLTVNFEVYDDTALRATQRLIMEEASMLLDASKGVPRSALEEGLACAKTCTTVNSLRPELTHSEIRDGRMLSSDGRKIMVLTHDGFPKDLIFKCPSVALNSVIGAVKNAVTDVLNIGEGKSYYYLQGNGCVLGVRKIERSFPAVESMISACSEPEDEVSVDKLVLEAMIRGVALGLQTDDVRVTLDAVGSGSDAYLEVSTLNSLGRRSHERASCGRKSVDVLSVPISFKHILDTLSVFKGDSVVDMLFLTSRSIVMIRDTTEDREVMTVIPFRTQAAIDAERKEADAASEAKATAKAAGQPSDLEETVGDALDHQEPV